ncbi:hypothetical protein [Streptomyces sp. NPDC057301]|uniref:hypothetical protein n=1 Tax=Streptomyces sp. NPDC057301 TaxID=3346093 RepID=UPI0036427C04
MTDSDIRALTPGPRKALMAKRDAYQQASGAMTIDEVADHHVDLVLGSLHTDPELIASALAAVRAT